MRPRRWASGLGSGCKERVPPRPGDPYNGAVNLGTEDSKDTRAALAALYFTLCLAGCGGSESGPEDRVERPNLLLVTLDTTRPDYLGAYGYKTPTPGFDELAAEGVRFDAAISSSALTPASHATMLTGQYPDRHGVRVLSAEGGFRLPETSETLTTILRDAGYATASVNSAFPVSSYFGFDHGFEVWESVEGALRKHGKGWDFANLQRRSDATTDVALNVLKTLEEPFFLWIHYWDPHDLAMMPPRDALPEPSTVSNADDMYAAEVRYVGSQFARLCDGLRNSGALDRTVTVLTADHGEGLLDGLERHGWGTHRMLYQEQIRVPLIVRGPSLPAGRVVSDLVRTVDLAPTITELLGLPPLPDLDGRSLLPLIAGEADEARSAYAEQINGYDKNAGMLKKRPDAGFLYCVIRDSWKLVYRPHMLERSELFHLAKDPEERTNLFAERPVVRTRLLTELATRNPWVLAPFTADASADARSDEDVSEALSQLGYTGGGEIETDSSWRWTCVEHLDHRQDEPGRHADCSQPLIPVRD